MKPTNFILSLKNVGMKKMKLLGALLAIVFASMQSFTKPSESDWVWFRANSLLGIVANINEGMRGDTAPPAHGCGYGLFYCSEAFSISQGEVSPIEGSAYYHLEVGNNLGILQFAMNGLATRPVP
jgi:hypothetical protein